MVTCGGRDADEAGDHALDGSHDGGLLEEDDVEAGPDEEAHGGADVGVEHRHGRHHVGGVRPAAVEAGPPHPQQARAGEREQDVVGREPLPVLLRPGPHLHAYTSSLMNTALHCTHALLADDRSID